MEVQFAVAKIGKYATSESGDTLEMIERPHGGLSFVPVDGQRSGKSAKAISNLVARKAIQLLSEGVRDGAEPGRPMITSTPTARVRSAPRSTCSRPTWKPKRLLSRATRSRQ